MAANDRSGANVALNDVVRCLCTRVSRGEGNQNNSPDSSKGTCEFSEAVLVYVSRIAPLTKQ